MTQQVRDRNAVHQTPYVMMLSSRSHVCLYAFSTAAGTTGSAGHENCGLHGGACRVKFQMSQPDSAGSIDVNTAEGAAWCSLVPLDSVCDSSGQDVAEESRALPGRHARVGDVSLNKRRHAIALLHSVHETPPVSTLPGTTGEPDGSTRQAQQADTSTSQAPRIATLWELWLTDNVAPSRQRAALGALIYGCADTFAQVSSITYPPNLFLPLYIHQQHVNVPIVLLLWDVRGDVHVPIVLEPRTTRAQAAMHADWHFAIHGSSSGTVACSVTVSMRVFLTGNHVLCSGSIVGAHSPGRHTIAKL
jgi:hypothetical protein